MINRTIKIACMLIMLWGGNCIATDAPVTIDNRIKTFVYSENEIFPIVLNYGYQTAIEFGKDEKIKVYSVGDQFLWQFSAVGRTLFIKPLEENITTNMTVLTDKHRYYFTLYSRLVGDMNEDEISYVIRFFYPDNANDNIKYYESSNNDITIGETNPSTIKPYNFNYQIIENVNNEVVAVFDNDLNTFIKTKTQFRANPPQIECGKTMVKPRIVGNYLVVDKLCDCLKLQINGKTAVIKKNRG